VDVQGRICKIKVIGTNMNERIYELAVRAKIQMVSEPRLQEFAELIIKDCIDKIETYRIPVGNSAAGEMACEWTYAALKEIRDDIKENFGVDK
jgi:hypothetical protein